MSDARFTAARNICRRHARSFYTASFFLPKAKRDAAYAVYAFCRLLDDATDLSPDPTATESAIARFTTLLDDVYAGEPAVTGADESSLAIAAFAQTVRQFAIPRDYFDEVAAGCRMDLTITRYATWAELQTYCYRVAGVVGLIMCRVFELRNPAAEAQAVQMGNAMQLTNILRDVREDLERGRIYLPAEDMHRFGVTESDLASGRVDDNFIALMRFEIDRARTLYRESFDGLNALPADGSRGTAAAMATIYSGILDAIERRKHDVFSSRAHLNLIQKLARLPKAWRLTRNLKTWNVL